MDAPSKDRRLGRKGRSALWVTAGSLLVGAAFLVAGCGGDTEGEAAASAAGNAIAATLGGDEEFSITLDRDTVAAGDVVFTIANEGAQEHEFVVLKTDLAAEELPVADGLVDEAGIGGPEEESEAAEEEGIEVEDIAPGASAELKADLEAGSYVIVCNLPGHYEHGMRVALQVE